ncbi:hypothetical protein [Ralstonia flaminis]|jgi:putative transposase|uniref:Integrase catalytic domain-containing protein n=1 Tax=Ralstonia flaminis TaxID=3058597 RepID=A0ABM9KBB7_9RALS|nr:hypothetical protein [Ralstonia sp. LMG 18101]CAJ0822664.1 hypothetical protein LMG18101_05122 [Ralstonia sp. LMG 18101]
MARAPSFSANEFGRRRIPECYRSIESWPSVDDQLLKDLATRRRYQRLSKGIELYLHQQTLACVEEATGLSRSRFLRIFNRCLEPAPDGRIWGLRACIRGARTQPLRRIKAIEYHGDARAGFQGAFNKLLREHPKIEERLTEELKGAGKEKAQPNRLHFREVRKAFLRITEELGIPKTEYPFNTKARGARALRRWLNEVFIPRHRTRWAKREYGPNAAQSLDYQEGRGQAKRLPTPYEAWEIDENTIDLEAVYEIPNASGDWDEIELQRAFVIRAVDVATGAKLANRLVLAQQASAEDVAVLLWDAISGVTFGADATAAGLLDNGAGYPAAMIPALCFAVPRIIYLDNALAHLADHVNHLIKDLWGAKVKLGRPGTPQERPHIEADFSVQARQLIHQLPGTTGSGPEDPLRKSAAVGIKDRVPVHWLAKALDCYCANANALPAAAAGYIAPLERLKRSLASGALAPVYLPADRRRPHWFSKPCPVTVKVDLRNGRGPYINYLYVRYSSDILARQIGLRDKLMWARADFRDLRTVLLFDGDGREFDTLHAQGKWGKFPHDVRIRKLHARLKREGELGPRANDEPLACLLACLRKRSPHSRKAALELAYLLEYLKVYGVADWRLDTDKSIDYLEAGESVALLPVNTTSSGAAPQLGMSPNMDEPDEQDLFTDRPIPRRIVFPRG